MSEDKLIRKFVKLPGASKRLAEDIHNAIIDGSSYGTYMWKKAEKEDREYYEKYGRHRKKK